MREVLIHRVAGAVRFVSAVTRRPVTSRLSLASDEAIVWRRSRSGDYVVWRAEGLDEYTGHDPALTEAELEDVFQAPPAAPAEESLSFDVTVTDPSGELLSRRFRLRLPRRAAAPGGATPDLFVPVEVTLYAAPGARGAGHGGVLYAFVHDGRGQEGRLPGALVTVTIDGEEAGRGLTGPTGEALVTLPRLASFSVATNGGEVIASERQATVRASVRPALLAQRDGRWTLARAPDPDRDFSGGGLRSAEGDVPISTRRAATRSIEIELA